MKRLIAGLKEWWEHEIVRDPWHGVLLAVMLSLCLANFAILIWWEK